jgi:hypothetical protein
MLKKLEIILKPEVAISDVPTLHEPTGTLIHCLIIDCLTSHLLGTL